MIFDTGSSSSYLPTVDYEIILNYLKARLNCYTFQGREICECSSLDDASLPTLEFEFGSGKVYTMEPQYYLTYYDGYGCLFQFLENPSDVNYWILGDIYLRKFYQVYDMWNQRIGISPAYLVNEIPEQHPETVLFTPKLKEPINKSVFTDEVMQNIAVIGGSVLFLFLLCYAMLKYIKRFRKKYQKRQ
jgi:hypothetical protein